MDNNNNLTIPIAIVAAGILIAGGIYFSGSKPDSENDKKDTPKDEITLRPVDENDHIAGNPNADIIIVEYSDTECSYCKKFHLTMNRIIDEYGKDGNVAWVYRHFPIDSSHPKARKEAEATECATELGGNTAFWDYINKMFEIITTSIIPSFIFVFPMRSISPQITSMLKTPSFAARFLIPDKSSFCTSTAYTCPESPTDFAAAIV